MASTALSILSFMSLVAGYSFDITTPPTQCGLLSLQITGGSGKPPYTALVVPFGASPTSQEVRRVFQQQFSESSTSFTLPYPANSGFVLMVSDSNGIGTGGTSIPTSVGASSNTSCLPQSVSTSFSFQIIPNNAINQCETTDLAWTNNQGDVTILLVIPGGQSSQINIVNPTPGGQGNTTGFNWTPNVRAGTNVLLVAGDSRGPGSGGSVNTAVGNNPNQDSSCLNNNSPSSTAGTPAGAIQTDFSKGGNGNGGDNGNDGQSNNSTNVGAIVGGVVGGLAALAVLGLLAFLFIRRRRRQRHPAAHGVDLLPEVAQRDPDHPPEFYQPEPFVIPPASHADADENGGTSAGRPSMSDRRYSAVSTTDPSESAYGTTTGTGTNFLAAGAAGGSRTTSYGPGSSRKSPAGMPQLRPVNFVQHEDGGELPEPSGSGALDEPETIELPPSYTNIRR
ncbi:hypothetical protein K439DRAFT_1614971 [Ramaria rubella]|nr:hypothetical protein K439DRAFT_1614971 [Ramaria rubella]